MSMPPSLLLNLSLSIQVLMPNTISDSISKTKLFQVVKGQFTESSLTTIQRKYFNETRGVCCIIMYVGWALGLGLVIVAVIINRTLFWC